MSTIFRSSLVIFAIFVFTRVLQAQQVRVRVDNPSHAARQNVTVSVDWKSIVSHFPAGTRDVTVRDQALGKDVLSQLFDSNLDGAPDVLIFQADVAPTEAKTFVIRSAEQTARSENSFVDARYVEPREDVAWENDRIAFRVYGPALAAEVNNGIDVWTKRVRYLIVKKWYEGEERTPKIVYHIDHGEGADFFNVGRSLGCGGSGIWHNNKLYQPGVFSSYRILATGPIRTSFELYYDRWNVDGVKLRETERITLDAGQNLNRVDVTFSGDSAGGPLQVACGLVKRPNTTLTTNEEHRWMGLWGAVNDSLPNGYLGTGIVFGPSGTITTASDSSQDMMIVPLSVGSTLTYYAGAGWTRSGDFGSSADWSGYLDRWSFSLREPLKVVVEATDVK